MNRAEDKGFLVGGTSLARIWRSEGDLREQVAQPGGISGQC